MDDGGQFIYTDNRKKFCKVKQADGGDYLLETKEGSISFLRFQEQVFNLKSVSKSRGKRPKQA